MYPIGDPLNFYERKHQAENSTRICWESSERSFCSVGIQLIKYFTEWCKGPEALRDAILSDLQDPHLVDDLHALGIIRKYCTGHVFDNLLETGEIIESVNVKNRVEDLLQLYCQKANENVFRNGSDGCNA